MSCSRPGINSAPEVESANVPKTKPKWKLGGYDLLKAVEYRSQSQSLWVRYRNNDVGETSTEALWRGRPGQPDWAKVRIDPENDGAILVPTLPGQPTIEGEIAEIPGDVLRAATDVDYRARIAAQEARWAKKIGERLAQIRKRHGSSMQKAAALARVDWERLAGIEAGRIAISHREALRIATALGWKHTDLFPELRR
jgi:hypothetical protein